MGDFPQARKIWKKHAYKRMFSYSKTLSYLPPNIQESLFTNTRGECVDNIWKFYGKEKTELFKKPKPKDTIYAHPNICNRFCKVHIHKY